MKKIFIPTVLSLLILAGCKKATAPAVNDLNTAANSNLAANASAPGDVVGKVTVGYQGWFSCAGDGSPLNSWSHTNVENWPDMRQYTTSYAGMPFFRLACSRLVTRAIWVTANRQKCSPQIMPRL